MAGALDWHPSAYMIRKSVKSIFNAIGFEIRRSRPAATATDHTEDFECAEMIARVRDYTMVSHDGLASLFQQARFCERHSIPGAYVECGVWKGGAVALMALANLKYGRARRHIHLFDAFREICEPDATVDGAKAIREVQQWSRNGGVEGRLRPLKGFL